MLSKHHAVYSQSKTAGLDLVAKGAKALEAGAYTDAKNSIDEAFKLGLDNDLSARAMLIRAQANEKMGKLVGALSDYSGALFMQTLPSAERKRATEGKERVTAAMGLNSGQPKKGQAQTAASAPASSGAQQPASGGGVTGFFDNLFGGSAKPAEPAAKPVPGGFQTQTAAAPAQTAPAPPKPQTKASTPPPPRPAVPAKAEPARAEPAPKPAPVRQAAVKPAPQSSMAKAVATKPEAERPAAAPPSAEGGFLIDFGAALGEGPARAKAQQIKTQLADILVNRELIVQPAGGGFRVVAGPYKAKTSAAALCSAMKARGVPCQVTP